MAIIDTHAHYDDDAYDPDRPAILAQITENGVSRIVNCASSYASIQTTLGLVRDYPTVYAALGIHPSDGLDYTDEVEKELRVLLNQDKVVAVGEIGLDYYWSENPSRDWQKESLLRQFNLARECNKPVILHVRDAYGDMMEILRANHDLRGVLHAFSGSPEIAKEAVSLGFYLGVGGVSTFKNAKRLPEVIAQTPIEFLLTETDAPYLTPVPYRGKRNRSDYISYVITAIAQLKGLDREVTEQILYENALKFFGFRDGSNP